MALTKERHKKYWSNFKYEYVSKSDAQELLKDINERFAISYDFYADGYVFVKSKDKFWIVREEVLQNDFRGVSLEGIGIVFARVTKKGIKITTNFVQIFGKYFQKNVFEITEEEANKYARGYDLNKELPTFSGYVVLRYDSHYLGVGLYNAQAKLIKNMIPKARRIKKL